MTEVLGVVDNLLAAYANTPSSEAAPKGLRAETKKARKLRRQLEPGLRAIFGAPMQTSSVPQIKPKKGEKE